MSPTSSFSSDYFDVIRPPSVSVKEEMISHSLGMFVQSFKDVRYLHQVLFISCNFLFLNYFVCILVPNMLFFIFSLYDEAAESLHQLADKLPAPGNLSLESNLIGVYLVSYCSKNSSSW